MKGALGCQEGVLAGKGLMCPTSGHKTRLA